MKNQFLFHFLIMLSMLSCKTEDAFDNLSPQLFVNEVLDIMEANSVNRKIIDWTDFRNKVLKKIESAQTIQQTYSIIKEALVLLDDNHKYFFIKAA